MNLATVLLDEPSAAQTPIEDPLSLGFQVSGLPAEWRRAAADLIDGTPGITWIDSTSLHDATQETATSPFVSTTVLMAWKLDGLNRSPLEIGALTCALTEQVPGWIARSTHTEMTGGGAGIHLLGTLDSPFGPLISNVHNLVLPARGGGDLLCQLSVNAVAAWRHAADRITLVTTS